jgi:hypothetical protein
MEATNIRNLRHVYLRKVVALLSTFLFLSTANAQLNYLEKGQKTLYFGINMAINMADFKINPSPKGSYSDTIYTFDAKLSPGFNLGIIGNYQFSQYFDLRFIPSLSFSDKILEFTDNRGRVTEQTISSIYLDFPLQVRFKSQPIKDVRIFVLAGIRYDFDLAANQNKRIADDIVQLKKHDFAFEYGIGFQIFFPYFILSPEFKFTQGLIDIHNPTGSIYSRVIDKLFSRAFTISINFEG